MKSANEIREEQARKTRQPINLRKSLKHTVQVGIEAAAGRGLKQAIISVDPDQASFKDLLELKDTLTELGYKVMLGQESGFTGTNLLLFPSRKVTVLW